MLETEPPGRGFTEEPWGFKLSRIAAFLLSFFGVLGVTVALAGSMAIADGTVEPAWVAQDSFSFDALNTARTDGGFDSGVVAAQVQAAKAEHEQEISTPAAQAEREDSVDAFSDLGTAAVTNLITDVFAEPLKALTSLPTDPLLSSESAPKFNAGSDTSARIDPPGAEDSELIVSDSPLRNEENQIVSGQLQSAGNGFEPKAPLANVDLPSNSGGDVELPDVDVNLGFADAGDSAGHLVDAADGSGKEMVLYPNTQVDTDTAVTYTLNGIETFNYLRSAESPESFSLDYDLPDGASLQATADGGAIVLDSDGEALVTVFPPYAVDAQGTNVPVTLSVDGDSIKLDVPHQGKDFAYPIMVDPVQHVRDWWTNGSTPGFEGWSFYQDGTTQYNNSLDCPSSLASVDPCGGTGTGSGVYVSAVPTRTYPAGSKAYWRWVAPGGASSSITGATLSSWRYRKGNTNAGWAFYNLYNPTTNTSNGTTMTDGGGGSGLSLTGGNSGFKYLQSGLATNTANTIPTGASNWRYNRVAGYTATLTDGEAPTLDLGAGPTTWLPANTAFTVNAEGKDPGLGMGWINAQINGIWTNKWVGWCTGTYPYTCPATTGTQALSFNTNDFPNGVNTVSVNAMDIIAGTGHETAKPFTVKVDKSAPQVNLSGSLASIATGRSDLPQYDLMVNIKDGTAGTDNQSGVKTVKITIDGEEQSFPVNCSTYNCSFYLTEPYIVDALTYGSGSHNITVQATDMVNQQTTKSIDFTLNDLSKPAVTATGAIMAAGTPAVGVDQSVDFHATDVGYGVQKVEAKIDGLVVDSVEADSDCLAGDCALDGNLMVDSTGLAPGQHQLSLVATDFNGNVSNTLTKTYELDSGLPVVDVTGSLVDMSGLPLDDEILEANVQATDSANTHDTGIAKLAVKVDDVLVDEQTFSCSSSCASNHTFSYEYDATAVGEGPHDVTFIATDGAGNIGTQEFQMDTSEIPDSTICPTEGVDEVEAENPVSAEDAVVGIDSATPEVVGQLPMGSTPSGQDVQPMMAEAPEDSANPEKYEVSGSLAQTEASATDVPTVEVGDVVCLQPTRTTDAATEPAVVEDQALVYANTDSETDTTIRGTADGAAVVTTIRGSSAPKKFSWAVGLDDDQSLQMLADGSIAVVDNAISTNPTSTPDPVDPLQIEDLVEMDRLMEDGEYQLAAAQARVATSHVSAVLPDPVAEDANGNPVSVSYSISGGEITMNLGITGSTPLPVTVMSRFSSNPDMRDCLAGHAPCGEFNRARAAAYAQNWGQGRNPNYSDFGSNDCTNFVSQILRAGEMKFMREYKKGDGSWWSTRTRGRFGYEIRSTDSWRLADVLPQHLWEYHLGDRIYTGMNTWTSRDVIAWSWHNDGEVDHLQFVSGWSHNRDVPLIANHSGEGSNYGRMIWPRVLNRVHRDYPHADFRVLRIRNTRANIYEDGYPPRPTQFW